MLFRMQLMHSKKMDLENKILLQQIKPKKRSAHLQLIHLKAHFLRNRLM